MFVPPPLTSMACYLEISCSPSSSVFVSTPQHINPPHIHYLLHLRSNGIHENLTSKRSNTFCSPKSLHNSFPMSSSVVFNPFCRFSRISDLPISEKGKDFDGLTRESRVHDFFEGGIGAISSTDGGKFLDLFDGIGPSRDCRTYSMIISCYCKRNEPDEAKKVLDYMTETGFRPNVVTFTILIKSFCDKGKIHRAFEVLDIMKRTGCKPNVQTYNCLLKGLCFVGRVEEAYEMLMNTKKDGQSRDIYSYTAVMDGLCKVGRSDEAMELLDEAIGIGLTPNVVTYNTLFNGYCKEGRPRNGIELLKQMKQRGCEPDYISYCTLMHCLLKWSETIAAFLVYKEMVELGFKLDERLVNTLLRAMCRESQTQNSLLEHVYHLYEQIRSSGYAIYPKTYCVVIKTFCIEREIDKALFNLNEMVLTGHFPRMMTINRLIRVLCEEGRINEALSVLVLAYETSRTPNAIGCKILIDVFNRRGSLMGACNVYGFALKLGVVSHIKPSDVELHG